MWNYICYLCGTNTDDYLCKENCKQIKRIVELYGIDSVRESLEYVFIRDTEPIKKRTEAIANKIHTRSQNQTNQQSKEEKKS